MFIRLPNFGSLGVVNDTVGEALPIGAFTNAHNMRFTGVEMRKMLEPVLDIPPDLDTGGTYTTPLWLQFWTDGISSYAAIAADAYLYVLKDNGIGTAVWTQAGGPYSLGNWQSFAWGDTCIFNNGVDNPQIYNNATGMFEDLPGWGLISTGEDILNSSEPSNLVQASCTCLVPFKSFLVACGVTESGLYQPNKVWWSDSTTDVGLSGAPNWDYETPASLSGQVEIDPESGSINTAVQLNENLIIYTDTSASAMTFVGGRLVMQFRRLFNKGAAGLHCVAEFNNQHFCVAQDQIYLHDGSTVNLIAKDRVEEEFFKRIGKGGRYGGGSVDWKDVQVVKNADRKEIMIVYGDIAPICTPVTITTEPLDQLPVDGESTVTFTVVASGTAPISYQWFEDGVAMAGETTASVTVDRASTAMYAVAVDNACGTAISDAVMILTDCKVYECDSYLDYLSSGAVTAAWPFDDPALQYSAREVVTAGNIYALGGFGNPPFGIATNNDIDDCDGVTQLSTTNTASVRNDASYGNADFITSINGGMGSHLNRVSNGNAVLLQFWWNYPSNVIRLATGTPLAAGRLGFWIEGANSGEPIDTGIDYDTLQDGENLAMVWDVNPDINTEITVRLFKDFVEVFDSGTVTGTIPFVLAGDAAIIFGGGTTGTTYRQYGWYADGTVDTATLMPAMSDAWEQNKSTYVDQRPECTPCKVYECNALDLALPQVTGIIAAWRMIYDATDADWGQQNQENIIPNAEDLRVTQVTSSQIRDLTVIDPCQGTQNLGYLAFGGGSGGTAWTTRSDQWDFDLKRNHTFGTWARLVGSSSTYLPIFSIENYILWTVRASDGAVKVRWRNGAQTESSIELGTIWPLDGDYHQITLHFSGAATTAPVTAWFEIDGVRTTDTLSSSMSSNVDVPGRLQLFSADSTSQSRLGCDYLYPWVAAGEVSAQDIQLLADAYAQNSASFVDQRPECTPCKVYECDSYTDAVQALSPDGYWPMNRTIDLDNYPTSKLIKDYSGNGCDLIYIGPAEPQVIASNMDITSCSSNATEVLAGSTTECQNLGDYPLSGTAYSWFGNINDLDTNADSLFSYKASNGTWEYNGFTLSEAAGTPGVITSTFNYKTQTASATAEAIVFDFAAYNPDWETGIIGYVWYQSGTRIHLEFYINFVLVDELDMPLKDGVTEQYIEPNIPCVELYGLQGAGAEEYVLFNRRLISEEIATLKDAYAQNSASFQDQRPECTPCKVYECDSYETALTSVMDAVWDCHDASVTAGNTITDLVAGHLTTATSGTVGSVEQILQDQCQPESALSVGTGYFRALGDQPYVGNQGGMGAFADDINFNALTLVKAVWNVTPPGAGNSSIGINFNPVADTATAFCNSTQLDGPAGASGKYIWMNYVWSHDGDLLISCDVELYYDWVLVASGPVNSDGWLYPPLDLFGFLIGSGGTGQLRVEYVAASSTQITTEQAATLADALAQNSSTYIDQRPECQ